MAGRLGATALLVLAVVSVASANLALPSRTTLDVEQALRSLGNAIGCVVAIDDGLRGKRIRLEPAVTLDLAAWHAVLGTYGVDFTREEVQGHAVLRAFSQRGTWVSLPQPFFGESARDPIVTALYRPRYADAGAISTAIRRLATRAPVVTVACASESRTVVITGPRSAVESLLRAARSLDAPGWLVRLEREWSAITRAFARTGSPRGAAGR
jgi:type II secretory pathway component GspD/PulD (secretin)